MVFVAWWTGRGYTTILVVVAAVVAFELLRAALKLPEGPWTFGLSLLGAAVANWVIGRKFNRKSLSKVRTHRLRERLIYRARHKFMSLPMETFSAIIALAGMAILAWAMIGTS